MWDYSKKGAPILRQIDILMAIGCFPCEFVGYQIQFVVDDSSSQENGKFILLFKSCLNWYNYYLSNRLSP